MSNIELPASAFTLHIKSQEVYKDKKSLEESTGVIKKKFKLACNLFPELDLYNFLTLTSSPAATAKDYTLSVAKKDWENRQLRALTKPMSYIDIRKIEIHDRTDIAQKIKDKGNKFRSVARMPDTIYKKLQSLRASSLSSRKTIPYQQRARIDQALGTPNTATKVLQSLGLL